MRSELFKEPHIINMGFHYTIQFSRRTRTCVVGLIDQGSEEWERWYLRMHEPEALREIADAGYTVIEIHFLYGYGLKGEREEWERTRTMTEHAHEAGLRVFGYFQFHSVQEETFFLENPWAKECVQIDAEGKRIQYNYDRPALCFTNPKVRQYYLDGIELGLKTCGLDGIRLDNDYYKGCCCPRCREAFQAWLRDNFDEAGARRVFGLSATDGMSLAPVIAPRDPLWMATVKFRHQQRRDMMCEISKKVHSINPDAVLGGNPAVGRSFNDLYNFHVYVPDLGETHNLVCAENHRFPARTGESIRHQVVLYKHGQSNRFAVFASHHLRGESGGKLLITGKSCCFDEWGMTHAATEIESLIKHTNVTHISDTPEKITFDSEREAIKMLGEKEGAAWYKNQSSTQNRQHIFANSVRKLLPEERVRVYGSPFVALDTFENTAGEHFLHLLNYDNSRPCDVSVIIRHSKDVICLMPEGLGTLDVPVIHRSEKCTAVELPALHTYCIIRYKQEDLS